MRANDGALEAVSSRKYILSVFVLILCTICLLASLLSPRRNIPQTIAANPEKFFLFSDGDLIFGTDEVPTFSSTKTLKVKLPLVGLAKFPGYTRDNIWYRFYVNVPEASFIRGKHALLIPQIKGESTVFVNGRMVDFGNDIEPIVALENSRNEIIIHANTSRSSVVNPMSATFPLLYGSIADLREIDSILHWEHQAYFRSLCIYGVALVLFGMLFLAYPRKPELLAFIVFLSCSLANTIAIGINDMYSAALPNFFSQQTLLLSLDVLNSMSLYYFSQSFFRAHPKRIVSRLASCLLATLILGPPLVHLITKWTGAISIWQVSDVLVNFGFFIAFCVTCAPIVVAIWRSSTTPSARKIACLGISICICVVYCLNILDYFFEMSAYTSPYCNGLLLNLSLSVIVAYEISRAEVNQLLFGSMLPKEVRELVHKREWETENSGFVILLDAVGFSADRERFERAILRSRYVDELAERLLVPLKNLEIANFSILNCTGDGLYCAILGGPTRENFRIATDLAFEIVGRSGKEGPSGAILFRAAIGYGEYAVKVIQHGSVRKEFVAGNVLNDLARIINGKEIEECVRILRTPAVEGFLAELGSSAIVDKHGFVHRFSELKKKKRAA